MNKVYVLMPSYADAGWAMLAYNQLRYNILRLIVLNGKCNKLYICVHCTHVP